MSGAVRDKKVCKQLSAALSSGHPAGSVGALVTSVVKVSDISRAITFAQQAAAASALSQRAQQLLATAVIIKQLRDCIKVDDWDGACVQATVAPGRQLCLLLIAKC